MLKVSIITVCYNSAETIRDTIESILEQDYPHIEHIVVDGASRDATMDIVNEYKERIARIVSEPDKGIYDAMNKGISAATGDVVGILNSDDVFATNNAVSLIASCFDESVDGVYADLVYVQRNDPKKVTRVYKSESYGHWMIRLGIMVPHPTFYVRRAWYSQFGLYKLTYRVAADFELATRFIVNGIRLRHLPAVLVRMREGGISSNGLWWRVHHNFEIIRACRENGVYTNVFLIACKIPFRLMSYGRRA